MAMSKAERTAGFSPVTPQDGGIAWIGVPITDSQGQETYVSAGRIPDTDTTLVFSLPFERAGGQLFLHLGVYRGAVPDKSAPEWPTFEAFARRLNESDLMTPVVVERFNERVTQIVRDEQHYARATGPR